MEAGMIDRSTNRLNYQYLLLIDMEVSYEKDRYGYYLCCFHFLCNRLQYS